MNTKHDFCPGCGAQVYPEETQCPFCGRSLRSGVLTPVVVGLSGTVVALVAGALVWWVLSSPAPRGSASAPVAPPAAVTAQAPEAAAESAVPPTVNVLPRVDVPTAAPVSPPPVAAEPPLAPPPAAPLSAAPAPPRAVLPEPATTPPAMPFAPPPGAAALDSAPRVAVTPTTPVAPAEDAPAGDPESRRAFAKNKQDSFAQNGLDLQVSTSGPQDTTLTIKFNFSAKTAAELIVAGPFPKQCEQRGFKEILFQDPSGATWVYDIATQKMSVR
ncbi:zinc ribbon domain-containing protein [Xanthobacter agilis]|uniref:Zinc ribbon domain-containing protein n=1 Tax=Xanthobacter agilis TaxID=47492 RepID=A0ABU0LIL5_XANAG|nr:zinc ribbon domain-containing protein [Xanthobacter agilis]MDQ0506971.1 hypothetical protein [Xanthobacter agilis]